MTRASHVPNKLNKMIAGHMMVNPNTGNKAVKDISGAQTKPPSTLKSNNSQNMEDNGTDKYDTMIEKVAPPSSNAINRV